MAIGVAAALLDAQALAYLIAVEDQVCLPSSNHWFDRAFVGPVIINQALEPRSILWTPAIVFALQEQIPRIRESRDPFSIT